MLASTVPWKEVPGPRYGGVDAQRERYVCPVSCRQKLGICMPGGHRYNASPWSSGAHRPKDKVKKSSTSSLSQEAPSQAWRAWKDTGRWTSTLRAPHLFFLARNSRNKNPQLLWVRSEG